MKQNLILIALTIFTAGCATQAVRKPLKFTGSPNMSITIARADYEAARKLQGISSRND